VKKELNLQTLINLKQTIETLISSTQQDIIVNNPVLLTNKGETVDTEAMYLKLEKYFIQLDEIKLAIDVANDNKTSLNVSNKELIFELSSLKRKKTLLETLFNSKFENREGKQQPAWKFTLPKNTIDDKILAIDTRMKTIKGAMTLFNSTTTVKVDLDKDLELL